MGHTCSKSAGKPASAQAGALESDPRQRRNHNKKTGLSLTASGAQNCSHSTARVSSHGIFKSDPALFELQQRSLKLLDADRSTAGQDHLLYKQQQKCGRSVAGNSGAVRKRSPVNTDYTVTAKYPLQDVRNEQAPPEGDPNLESVKVKISSEATTPYNTRLVVRRHAIRAAEEGVSGRHIYAVRWPRNTPLQLTGQATQNNTKPLQEQSPHSALPDRSKCHLAKASPTKTSPPQPIPTGPNAATSKSASVVSARSNNDVNRPSLVDNYFSASILASPPRRRAVDWVTVSEEHCIYIADVGLSHAECDHLVRVTEHVCSGQYSAYTYAKQTLGCREYPILAAAVQDTVHTVVHAIFENAAGGSARTLSLDDREPHMVKYDVTKKERQKLDMHTDKSDWTFLIALSNGCGIDYEGGGTYFEVLDATLNVQRGHALIFPGKLRHCGQRISAGLRFLLVGFLVDKGNCSKNAAAVVIDKKTQKEDENDDVQRSSTNMV